MKATTEPGATGAKPSVRGEDMSGEVIDASRIAGGRVDTCCLAGADLRGLMLDGTVFRRCRLERARADAASLRRGRIEDCFAQGADFRQARLSGAILHQSDFSRGLFDGATMESVVGDGCSFRGASLRDVVLRAARLHDADFRGADLGGADLQGCDLTGADFRGALIADARFDEAILDDVRFDLDVQPGGRAREPAAPEQRLRELMAALPEGGGDYAMPALDRLLAAAAKPAQRPSAVLDAMARALGKGGLASTDDLAGLVSLLEALESGRDDAELLARWQPVLEQMFPGLADGSLSYESLSRSLARGHRGG